MSKRRIHSMTSAQTARACEAALALTRDWLHQRFATQGRYGGAAAYADFARDCYVCTISATYRAPDGAEVSAELVWRLDHTFAAIAPAELRSPDEGSANV